jgi:regulator of protease activity HflC (stomatin/prohibitin superfamily)
VGSDEHSLLRTDLTERAAKSLRGASAAVGWSVAVVLGIIMIVVGAPSSNGDGQSVGGNAPLLALGVVVLVASVVALRGFLVVQPNEAKVVVLLGRYRGTVRIPGFHWVNPVARRTVVSLRVRNFDSDSLKVNDAVGNPIEIAAVVNWQVRDTAQALFNVQDYVSFVSIQAETAVRHVASEYPYDTYTDDGVSLRTNADEVMSTLQAELQQRLEAAGVNVLDTRLRRLAYAPEIAGEMLRRQQASAVVAARQRIVEGAIGMVHDALGSLEDQEIVELDAQARAALVSNLLVVLVSDRGAQPIVNSSVTV